MHAISNVSPIANSSACDIRQSSQRSRRESSKRFTINPRGIDEQTAVRAWLSDLVMDTESECWTALQSKALPRRTFNKTTTEASQTRDLRDLTTAATAAATELLVRADEFTRHLQKVFE